MLSKIFKKQTKTLTAMFSFAVIFSLAFVLGQAFLLKPVSADSTLDLWGVAGGEEALRAETGLGDQDPRVIAANVINVILGFLGIIAVILILVGGFKWMTAAGNDEAINSAKSLMTAGVVGLLIILAAFGIAKFVIQALITATT